MNKRFYSIFNKYSTSDMDMTWNKAHSSELAVNIPYSTSESGIILQSKTPPKITYTFIILAEHGIMTVIA